MTILITGATGLIGSQLAAQLIAQNHTVHYLTTRESKLETRDNYKGFLWNVNTQTIDKACLNNVTTIVHLAGATVAKPWTTAYKQEILDSRIESIALLHNALGATPNSVKHIITASGISIYPGQSQEEFSEDSTQIGTDFLANVTQRWEAQADTFKELNIALTKVRTGVVFHASQGALPKIMQPIKFGLGSVLGSGKQWISWIHIDDICQMYMHLITTQQTGVFNGVAPEVITNKQLTKTLANYLKKPLFLPAVPSFILKVILGPRAALVLEGPKVSAKKIQATGFNFNYPTLDSAISALLK